MRRYRNKSKPRLEALESRVMLSAGDSPANSSPQIDWSTVVHASGTEAPLVEVYFNNQGMRITGTTGSGSVEIDLSQLPASVTNLQISSFESVTLNGEATIRNLVVSDVKKVDAGHLNAEKLFTYGVERVRIDNSPIEVWLAGAKDAAGNYTLGGKTLFETNHFSTSPEALIWGYVESLGLMTSSHVETLPLLLNGSAQPVLMNFTPDAKPKIGGLPEATTIEGDFAKYFFSNRNEQAQLEKASVVIARAALVQPVSNAQLLGNPRLQAMLSDGMDANGTKIATTPVRPLIDSPSFVTRPDLGVNRAPVAKVVDHADAHAAAAVSLEVSPGSLPVDSSAAAGHEAHAAQFVAPESVVPASASFAASAEAPSRQGDTAVLSALSIALARLSDPFVQTVSDLQGRFATFGEIASAQVTDRLRTDGRPALLVDARSAAAKTRAAEEVVIVHV